MAVTFDDSAHPGDRRDTAYGPHLVVLLECDRPLAGGARYSLDGVERVTIGRGEERSVTRRAPGGSPTLDLQLPGRSLSAAHARLVRVGRSWAVEDLESKNGTFVNGQRVQRAILDIDDLCELGHVVVRVNPSVPMTLDAPLDLDTAGAPGDVRTTLDPAMAAQLDALERIAPADIPVLVLGDSGTGKELLARWVHARSGRKGDFIAVNCGAIPSPLVESSFFGHVKGAFSGAVRDERGFVRAAEGGTLFLDEIADLPKDSQAALLRVLEEHEVVPVGATRPIPVDVRVVVATHQALESMVTRGDFRRDLYARVAGFTVDLPPLRARRDDFGVLVATLLRKVARERAPTISFAPEVGRALLAYPWPLNIRELAQCLAASVSLSRDGRIGLAHLAPHIARVLDAPSKRPETPARAPSAREDALRLELLTQLARHGGNLAEVGRAMGKARMQVHRWCKRFGVDPNVYRR